MVLKGIRLSSGDQIPVHKNTLSFSIKVVRFLIVYLEMDNENVYSFTHSFVNPFVYIAQHLFFGYIFSFGTPCLLV